MKNLIITIVALLSAAFAVKAENYPYRDDMLWVTVPDHADWIYGRNENPAVEISLYRYGVPVGGGRVDYEIGDDHRDGFQTGSITLDSLGRGCVIMPAPGRPGFRDLRLKADVDGQTTSHHIKLGFDPDSIKPYVEMPGDFDEFWLANLVELKKLPLRYTISDVPEYSTDKVRAYLVKLETGRRGRSMYGYLYVPRDAEPGSCPIVMSPPGAGVKPIRNPLAHRFYAENGCIRFDMEIHGLNPTMDEKLFNEVSAAFGQYLRFGLENRDNYYMKGVYLGLIRAIDFLTTVPEWDGRNVITQGGSQGGALAIVAAALDERVTACVANHPALSDMCGYAAGGTGGYPHFFSRGEPVDERVLETLKYYDVVNFARRLKVPVYMTWGFNDNTCTPTTSYAVYNSITAPREALITPVNEHWTSDRTERGHLEWIKKHLLP